MNTEARKMLADNLYYLLESRGISQSDLAVAMDVSTASVSDWCSGKKYPRADKIQRLADYFSMPMSAIVDSHALVVHENRREIDMMMRDVQSVPDYIRFLRAYLAADPVYRDVALEIMESHPAHPKKER